VYETWLSVRTRRGSWRLKGFADRLCEAGHDLAARTAAALRRAEAGGQWGSGPEGGNALDQGFMKDMSVNLQVWGAAASHHRRAYGDSRGCREVDRRHALRTIRSSKHG
jgi:hypothetical protein